MFLLEGCSTRQFASSPSVTSAAPSCCPDPWGSSRFVLASSSSAIACLVFAPVFLEFGYSSIPYSIGIRVKGTSSTVCLPFTRVPTKLPNFISGNCNFRGRPLSLPFPFPMDTQWHTVNSVCLGTSKVYNGHRLIGGIDGAFPFSTWMALWYSISTS
ncbi:hypothetical protein HAX54_022036 [Datura stramonium]|uniref:Uncharacterized protein n=1 Tax=Datura stramonium TaxID=4076 RepID=A0ABS8UW16_DATST|nr:hypothetical protein [Datura stramonium]